MKNDRNLHVPFNAPLNINDTINQTQGCRHTNPDICKYSYLNGICAFSSEDHICKKPSRAWAKQYSKLCMKEGR